MHPDKDPDLFDSAKGMERYRAWVRHLMRTYGYKTKTALFTGMLSCGIEVRADQKVRDLYTTAIDYDKRSSQALAFFKKVQNKMLGSVTGKTAAELIENRSDSGASNMGLTSWKDLVVRKGDVGYRQELSES